MIMLPNQCAGCARPVCCFANDALHPHLHFLPIPACGPAAQAAPAFDVVRPGPCMPDSLQLPRRGQQASKRGGCPSFGAIKGLMRVCGLLIDEAEPIHLQHEEPDEMVVQMVSIEDLRWALIAAEKELAVIEAGGVYVQKTTK